MNAFERSEFDSFFVRIRGKTLGPYGCAAMQQMANRNQITKNTDVSCDGVNWNKAADFPVLFEGSKDFKPKKEMWSFSLKGVQQQTQVELTLLQTYIASGTILPQDLVWKEGWVDWIAIESVAELAVFIPSQVPIEPNPPIGPGGDPQIQQGSNGFAIAGFVLSLCCNPCFLGLIFSSIALASKNKNNRGLAIAGFIIGLLLTLGQIAYIIFSIIIGLAQVANDLIVTL